MSLPEAARGSLWVRYVDWCSAQVARLAQSEVESPSLSRAVVPLARQLAVELYEELGLPPYPRWCEEYQQDPSRFDPDILGFQAPATADCSGSPPD